MHYTVDESRTRWRRDGEGDIEEGWRNKRKERKTKKMKKYKCMSMRQKWGAAKSEGMNDGDTVELTW